MVDLIFPLNFIQLDIKWGQPHFWTDQTKSLDSFTAKINRLCSQAISTALAMAEGHFPSLPSPRQPACASLLSCEVSGWAPQYVLNGEHEFQSNWMEWVPYFETNHSWWLRTSKDRTSLQQASNVTAEENPEIVKNVIDHNFLYVRCWFMPGRASTQLWSPLRFLQVFLLTPLIQKWNDRHPAVACKLPEIQDTLRGTWSEGGRMRPTREQVEQSIPRSTWVSSPLLVKLGDPTSFGRSVWACVFYVPWWKPG